MAQPNMRQTGARVSDGIRISEHRAPGARPGLVSGLKVCVQVSCLARDLCAAVAHRQFVFTIPKRMRIFFRSTAGFLGELPRLAWQWCLKFTAPSSTAGS